MNFAGLCFECVSDLVPWNTIGADGACFGRCYFKRCYFNRTVVAAMASARTNDKGVAAEACGNASVTLLAALSARRDAPDSSCFGLPT